MESNMEKNDSMIWESSTPIFQNPLLIKQIASTFWLPILVLFVAVSFLTNFALEVVSVMALILLASLGAQLLVFSLYHFNYSVLTTLDDKGIQLRPALLDTPQWKTVRAVATFLGIFSRRPGIAGGAILSGSASGEMMMWEEIIEFSPQSDNLTYLVKLNGNRKTMVICTKENFEEVGVRYKTMFDFIRAEYSKDNPTVDAEPEVKEETKE
jgi:hypothetical protein